ncbi:MAG: carbohydrate binding domain-containing protein [Bacteroidaceae bacterium]|nr:carbohydrate binding domain-containing protein [Bacteroidaceae bacterium]
MKRFVFILTLAVAVVGRVSANEPDSVYLFSYNPDPAQGLSFAYSADGRLWTSVADGMSFVKSDYSAWGSEKKMHRPVLARMSDGSWQLTFALNDKAPQYGITASPDLVHWKPQDYPFVESAAQVKQMFDEAERNYFQTVSIGGKDYKGCINRISFRELETMKLFQQAAEQRSLQQAESLGDDATRFASLKGKELKATIHIDTQAPKAISDKLIGIFFEDINYSADGGLYAELLQNRDFEYTEADKGRERNWTPTNSWSVEGEGMTFRIATDQPLHPNQTHYALLDVQAPGAALENDGFDGIVVRKGERYDVSLFARQLTGKSAKWKVQLRSGKQVLGESTLAAPGKDWKQVKGVLTANADATDATLAILPQATGQVALDFVSLFPQNTFKGRKNGLRPDLAQMLADLQPRFMRFPGGCVAHGEGLDNMYHWKETIGPLWKRKPLRNLWGYHQTRGLGYYEFFQFCEDLGCEPLPVVAAAVSCQNSSTGGGGQQGGIPFGPEFEQYKQDLLDLIEWANGDPKTSKWARLRAEAGHPKPFNLKYLGIGNEDLISDTFTERYLPLIQAVKERYPEIIVCGTTGPFFEGSDYEQGWRLAKDNHIDMVDEHYYVAPGWYIHNQDFYDQYDRSASKVYLGEYASHGPGRKSTIQTALTCAMHICNLERNGDVVAMSSYAPLLAKKGHTQWNPDLIYFDNETIYPTVDYYVQRMCGQSQGDQYLPSRIEMKEKMEVTRRLAVSTVRDSSTGRTYLKLVNLLPQEVEYSLALGDLIADGVTGQLTILSSTWDDQEARPAEPCTIALQPQTTLTLPAYAFAVLEF